jgi:hypothetical protein
MINHFRTLILNKAASNVDEHVAKDFAPLVLPKPLAKFHALIVPPAEADFQKLYRMYSYERAVQAAGMEEFTRSFDSRVTYNLDEIQTYFSYNQISKSILEDGESTDLQISITAQLQAPLPTNELILKITQIDNSNVVSVYRVNSVGVVTEQLLSAVTLVWTNAGTNAGVSQILYIPFYNLTLVFSSAVDFTTTSNKSWKITVNAKSDFNMLTLADMLKTKYVPQVSAMLGYKSKYSPFTFDTMWVQHHNKVYQFAGLLLGYFYRVQSYLES